LINQHLEQILTTLRLLIESRSATTDALADIVSDNACGAVETSLRIYQDYCTKISGIKEGRVEHRLSKISFQNTTRSAGLPVSEYVSRSPFAALMGKGDENASIADLGENMGYIVFYSNFQIFSLVKLVLLSNAIHRNLDL
jgi:hypothetical protein